LMSLGSRNADGSVSLTPFHFFAATTHGGDTSAAASAIRKKHNAEQAKLTSPLVSNHAVTAGPTIVDPDDEEGGEPEEAPPSKVDLGLLDWNEAFGNHAPEVPIVPGLIFPGRWTAIVAPAKAGKSTWALHVAHRLPHAYSPTVRWPCSTWTLRWAGSTPSAG
jgi:hypothetical protein